MKARQSAKLRELKEALGTAGIHTLDEQAKALGLNRSTTWTVLRGNHKNSGLSAAIISRILAAPQLPPLVRAKILEYVGEKTTGTYGHSAKLRRKFITSLSAKRVGQTATPADCEVQNNWSANARLKPAASGYGRCCRVCG